MVVHRICCFKSAFWDFAGYARLSDMGRYRRLGPAEPGWMGMGPLSIFVLVGRYRSHAGTLISVYPLPVPSGLENGQSNPFCRSHDHFCRNVCQVFFPAVHVVGYGLFYWCVPSAESDANVAELLTPPCCGTYLRSQPTLPCPCFFWYVGLVPDLATLRDRVKSKLGKMLYGTFALG